MPEQIALIEIPIREIAYVVAGRARMEKIASVEILGGWCHVFGNGDHVEFLVRERRFQINFESLVETAVDAITAHLKSEIAARVLAARGSAAEGDGFVTLHPRPAP